MKLVWILIFAPLVTKIGPLRRDWRCRSRGVAVDVQHDLLRDKTKNVMAAGCDLLWKWVMENFYKLIQYIYIYIFTTYMMTHMFWIQEDCQNQVDEINTLKYWQTHSPTNSWSSLGGESWRTSFEWKPNRLILCSFSVFTKGEDVTIWSV